MRHKALAFIVALTFLFAAPAVASESRDPEVIKGNGIIEGIRGGKVGGGTLGFMKRVQVGCNKQFGPTPPAKVDALLKEFGKRVGYLEQAVEMLSKEAQDEARAVELTENSLKVQALVRLAIFAGESLFPLLQAGCVIEMRPE